MRLQVEVSEALVLAERRDRGLAIPVLLHLLRLLLAPDADGPERTVTGR